MKLHELTIEEASRQLSRRELSAVTLTQAVLDRIETLGIEDNTYVVMVSDNGYRHEELHLDPELADRALIPLQRMLDLSR